MISDLPKKTVNVQRLPKNGEAFTLSANGDLLDILTSQTAAEEVLEFSAEIHIKPWNRSGAVATGTIHARIAQQCVASLEPMETPLDIEFSRTFMPGGDPVFSRETILDGELLLDADGEDMPDVLDGNSIDIWPVLLEELNLEIDPYPRKAGFEWNDNETSENSDNDDTIKPFADLKSLMSKKNSQSD